MRGFVPAYRAESVSTLEQALSRLAAKEGLVKPLAGGTDLMVLLEAGTLPDAATYLDLTRIPELRGIHVDGDVVVIGATTTFSEIRQHPVIRAEFPALAHAGSVTGGVAIQNRGTLGGNIANASPAADSPPALIAYEAEIELASLKGARRVAYDAFHRGYKQMDLAPDELIKAIHLKRNPGRRHFYRKVGTRRAQAISKVVLAASALFDGPRVARLAIGIGSVGPTVIRARSAEAALVGKELTDQTISQALSALAQDVTPMDDIRSTRDYRLEVARNILEQALCELRS